MREAFLAVWQNPYVRVAVYLSFFGLLFWLARQASQVLVVFLLAYTLAYLVQPFLRALSRRGVPRWLGVVLVYLLGFLFFAIISVLLYYTAAELARFTARIPEAAAAFLGWVRSGLEWLDRTLRGLGLGSDLGRVGEVLSQDLGSLLQNFSSTLLQGLNALLAGGAGLLQGVAGLLGGLFQLFLALIIAAYLMIDFERVGATALLVFPKPYQPFVRELAQKLDRAVGGYLRGQLLVAFLAGLTLGIGYALAGVPMAPALGLIGGLFNLVPYLGGLVSLLLAVLVAATKSWTTVGLAVLVFVIENQLEANVYSPMILSKTTELHPLTVILAILVGGSLYGLWGALVAVPTAAFLKLLFYDYYVKSRFYLEG